MNHNRRAFLDFLLSFVAFMALVGAGLLALYHFWFGVGGGYLNRDGVVRTIEYLVDPDRGGVIFLSLLAVGVLSWVARPVPRAQRRA